MENLTEKGVKVRQMFNQIAPRYDLLNRLLSLGIDRNWRRFAVSRLNIPLNGKVLDVATGTGDVALEIARQTDPSASITGIDFSEEMVMFGKEKVASGVYSDRIKLEVAPCESIPYQDETFDGVTIAFGIRNVDDRQKGLNEMTRVLKKGGKLVVLEFSTPGCSLFKNLYYWYFKHILPVIGGLLSDFKAYKYLPDSVIQFPSREEFMRLMRQAGLANVTCTDLTGGIVSVYEGVK